MRLSSKTQLNVKPERVVAADLVLGPPPPLVVGVHEGLAGLGRHAVHHRRGAAHEGGAGAAVKVVDGH